MNGSSITCSSVRRDASSFLDGRMSARERGNAQRHLRECADCMRELQQLARLSRAMHNLPPHRVADGMAQRLRRQHDGSRAAPAERAVTQWAQPQRMVVSRRVALAALVAATLPLVFWLGYRSGRAATPFDAAPRQFTPAPTDREPLTTAPRPETPAPEPLQPRVRPAHAPPELVAPRHAQEPTAAGATAPAHLAADVQQVPTDEHADGSPPPEVPPLPDVQRQMQDLMRQWLEQVERRWHR